MMKSKPSLLFLAAAAMFAPATTQAAPVFYAIGGDSNGVPRGLYQIDTAFHLTANLGDGSLGFTGLANPGWALVTVGNNGQGAYAYSLDNSGSNLLQQFSVPDGVGNGGIAWNASTNSYLSIRNNFGGAELWQSSSLGASSFLFNLVFPSGTNVTGGGGITVINGMTYALLYDNNLSPTFSRIDLQTQTLDPFSVSFGAAMTGGLAYDPVGSTFYGVGNDNNFNSRLYSWQLNDLQAQALSQTAVGIGFSALVYGGEQAASNPVPEPSQALPLLLGCLWMYKKRGSAR